VKLYHGTSEAGWKAIQEEGVLWSPAPVNVPDPPDRRRYTWLSPEKEVAEGFGDVLLEVELDKLENFGWQIVVREPIPLGRITRIR